MLYTLKVLFLSIYLPVHFFFFSHARDQYSNSINCRQKKAKPKKTPNVSLGAGAWKKRKKKKRSLYSVIKQNKSTIQTSYFYLG